MRSRVGLALVCCLFLLPPLAPGGCQRKEPVPAGPGKVLLIGLDGAEWELLRPLAEAGQLPHLARLMRDGVQGNLRSLQPMAEGPAVWTTMATGKSPAAHGVSGVSGSARDQRVVDGERKVLAVWNIVSMAGRTAGVVAWPATLPPEPVNGFMVSDGFLAGGPAAPSAEAQTFPAGLASQIEPLVIDSLAVPWRQVQRFLDAPLDTVSMSAQTERLLAPIRRCYAEDLSVARIGEMLCREERPDFLAVCLGGLDAMETRYWSYMTPEAVPAGALDPEGRRLLKGAVHAYYRFTDELVGRLAGLADPQTTIMVVSGRGFSGGTGRGLEMYKADGVFIMAGRHARQGVANGATVYDLVPTMLVLMGLPSARDMDGRIFWPAIGSGISREKFTSVLPTYETGERKQAATPRSPVDDELKERLRSLGYLD